MRDSLNCLVDRLPGLLVGGAFALYHLPLLVVARDAENLAVGSGRLVALFVTLLDLAASSSRLFRDLGWLFVSVAAGEVLGCGRREGSE